MGVKHAHKLTYSIEGLSLSRVELLAQARYLEVKNNKKIKVKRMQQPTIDVDISWLYRSKSNIQEENRLGHVINICLVFARVGFCVVLVCDGKNPSSFKTSYNRKTCNNTSVSYQQNARPAIR